MPFPVFFAAMVVIDPAPNGLSRKSARVTWVTRWDMFFGFFLAWMFPSGTVQIASAVFRGGESLAAARCAA